ncbi:hypothetical protein CLV59_111173 [Chitinophaga dinghuensis]|uniref:Uncharacterized protein n=1 Tax=Chitinophaga dinghuensis TaxID=1539050 RepID=A0A327VU25_9BACT|nr:class I lanthipeptide [Chitinophaga dinghuensis]RAJ74053.1 hypothetical protein CLV59_111173 [Chitinophaga dinghuensis]
MEKKNKITLEKETLLRLQDDQMKALLGSEGQTTDSGVACGNTVDLPTDGTDVAQFSSEAADSCCRRSCNK